MTEPLTKKEARAMRQRANEHQGTAIFRFRRPSHRPRSPLELVEVVLRNDATKIEERAR